MTEKEYNGILVFAEQRNGEIHHVSYELLNKAEELAAELNCPIFAALLGPTGIEAEELIYRGAHEVYYLEDEAFGQPDELFYKENLVDLIEELKPEIILLGATNFGRSLAPRVAAALDTGLTADCTDLRVDEAGKLLQIRPAFSENILAQIETVTYPQMATVRYKEFVERDRDATLEGEIIKKSPTKAQEQSIEVLELLEQQKVNIAEAEVVVAGGKGIKKAADFELLQKLATKLGGVIGASRDIIDAGYLSKEYQIGYSGYRVAPKLYIACGISGAPQHVAGIKEADKIIAINTDPSAPIFEIADYGIIGDLYQVIPKLIEEVQEDETRDN
ncbi:electron transfer flavoprotein subunit alpha/FixB family protein [Natroniella sulfidigena]|uniref:electron transfer flavoprotein subunit alpha/FixB family protein n=1 Tax=Natroniella sulfidigena TaxID=723921 RepID=UPI00200B29FE|nr:electron transfer flavoprotein subunit alpha/FixB family protein [Natroniella sulfidigena]MCK8816880.1 electron transfer flavoprotein subunit alpha/FixB family protein [Natroniella sulfidigena]